MISTIFIYSFDELKDDVPGEVECVYTYTTGLKLTPWIPPIGTLVRMGPKTLASQDDIFELTVEDVVLDMMRGVVEIKLEGHSYETEDLPELKQRLSNAGFELKAFGQPEEYEEA